MCISVHRSTLSALMPWNPATGVITIPAGLSPGGSLIAIRAVLTELAVEQPAEGAVCYCGEAVSAVRVPSQRSMEGARVAS